MRETIGKSICAGITIGRMKMYSKSEKTVSEYKVNDASAEIERFEAAKATTAEELSKLHDKAVAEVGKDNAEIFKSYTTILEDEEFNDFVYGLINTKQVNAEYAVTTALDKFSEMFSNMDDEYIRARSTDVKDVFDRLVRILSGQFSSNMIGDEPIILITEDITPSEIVQLDRKKLLSFVTSAGSGNSHTAILARAMGVPALTDVEITDDMDGHMAIVDGYEGKLYVDPEEEVLEKYLLLTKQENERKEFLLQLKGKENVTKSGKMINLYANIGDISDVAAVLENDADGIGLFRTEFLYFKRNDFPTEEEQFMAYKKVLDNMGRKKVIFRTLDIGADKQVDYFNLDKEDNPALGYRAIRICLNRPEIFRTQLRAIFRASAYGNVSIMYPMIISVEEVLKIKEISRGVREELVNEGVEVGNVEEGIMIETPAAAIMSDELAKYVDFFSIGTNDLSQYTMAIDRQNSKLDGYFNPHHPALLRLIKMVVQNGHKEGIWTGICGELGADTSLTEEFVKMGIDELSVAPDAVLNVRKAIREMK